MSRQPAASLAAFIEEYDSELRRVLTRRCGCIETASDIVQETYQRILAGGIWEHVKNPRALVYRIALNLATDHERRLATRHKYIETNPDIGSLESDTVAQPDRIVESGQQLERMQRAVERLPPKCRRVFLLRRIEGLSQNEIAECLGISRSMVEKHLRNAIVALHDRLQHDER